MKLKYNVKFEYETNSENKTVPIERESNYGLKVYDGNGKEYEIELNNLGELTIRANDGHLVVQPDCANVIILDQK